MHHLPTQTVWLLDAQTTGANPARGHLLELAWGRYRADGPPSDLEAHLVAQSQPLPRRISALTGIQDSDLGEAWSLERVYRALQAALGQPPAPVVIHYARFERPFLEDMYRRCGASDPPPLLCTHEVARRLFPDLPRRGLRALAGYLGHSVPPLKRAAQNVVATATLWGALTELLQRQEGVRDLDQLQQWLESTQPRKRTHFAWPMDRAKRLALPQAPGVYRMLDRGGQVLYVGKAMDLKRRVNSYFQKRRGHPEHIMELLTRAVDLDVTLTPSPLEAALLEADQIKALDPPCNIALRQQQRRVAFFSASTWEASPTPSPAHSLGPLPSARGAQATHTLLAVLGQASPPPERFGALLGLEDAWLPDPETCLAGWRALLRRHRHYLEAPHQPQPLLQLGAELWVNHQIRLQRARDSPREEDTAPVRPTWTADLVCAALEHQIMSGARRLRRACWLMRVCDGALWWTPPGQPEPRALSWIAGRPLAPSLPATKPPAPPPRRPWGRRLGEVDIPAYDRLVVLTAELRRLAQSRGRLRLLLPGGQQLQRAELRRALLWF
jgi:DNA polymerase-3 subunit epsilon